MNSLHLNLVKKWYDMIASNEKKEEYREISSYWAARFVDFYAGRKLNDGNNWNHFIQNINTATAFDKIQFRHYNNIIFSNGFKKQRPQFKIELKYIKIDYGKEEWGAEKGVLYFVSVLGNIIKGD